MSIFHLKSGPDLNSLNSLIFDLVRQYTETTPRASKKEIRSADILLPNPDIYVDILSPIVTIFART